MPSLRTKICALAGVVTLIGAGALTGAAYLRVSAMTDEMARRDLQQKTRQMLSRAQNELMEMRQDLDVLAGTPPIQGLARSIAHGGLDPEDGSTTALWRTRLERIFVARLSSRPHYTQLRYIGAADGGRELVRVDRKGDVIFATLPGDLQRKGEEPYFQIGAELAPGDFAFSDVTTNRERGKKEESGVRTLRLMRPVHDAQGRLFAMLVINADFREMLAQSLRASFPDGAEAIVASTGDYAAFLPLDGGSVPEMNGLPMQGDRGQGDLLQGDLVVGEIGDPGEPRMIKRALARPDSPTFEGNGVLLAQAEAEPGTNVGLHRAPVLTAISQRDSDDLQGPAAQAARPAAVAAILWTALATAAAAAFSAPLSRRLKAIAAALRASEPEPAVAQAQPYPPRLPVDCDDEAGEIARGAERLIARLRDSRARSAALTDALADAVVIADARGVAVDFSRSAEALFGYQAREVLGCHVALLAPIDLTGERRADGRPVPSRLTARRKDGSAFPAELSVSALNAGGRALICLVFRDLSTQSGADHPESIDKLEQMLRPPLSAMRGALASLRRLSPDEIAPRAPRLAEIAEMGADRLARLLDELRDLERIRQGALPLTPERVELRELVRDMVDQAAPMAEAAGIRFQADLEGPPIWVRADPQRLGEALTQLLANAARFSPTHGAVQVTATVSSGGDARISVIDSGPGLSEPGRDRLFNRLSARPEGAGRDGGGLGLSLARALAEAMGGRLSCESRGEAGAAFHLDLPAAGDAERRGVDAA